MSQPQTSRWRFWLAALFLVALLGLNLYPPAADLQPWKDPFLVVLAIAMVAIVLAPRKRN